MKKFIFPIFAIITLAFMTSSCDDSKSYAELLADENYAVNDFLVQHNVIDYVPSDTVFVTRREIAEKMFEEGSQKLENGQTREQAITEIMTSLEKDPGKDAPYYRIDNEHNVYMQVISLGTDEKPEKDDRVYFRFTRYNLFYYIVGNPEHNILIGSGNADSMNSQSTFFLFENVSVDESTQYGTGIQLPLYFVGYNSKVNIVVKSQSGPTSDMSYVVPYLYTITYYKSMI